MGGTRLGGQREPLLPMVWSSNCGFRPTWLRWPEIFSPSATHPSAAGLVSDDLTLPTSVWLHCGAQTVEPQQSLAREAIAGGGWPTKRWPGGAVPRGAVDRLGQEAERGGGAQSSTDRLRGMAW